MVQAVLAGGRAAIAPNFAAGCEVGDALVARLRLSSEVRAALRCTFERWNGQGFPDGVRGDAIPLAMRIVHLTHDMEAIARIRTPADALHAARDRRDRTYDPAVADLFTEHGARWLADLSSVDPWAVVMELEPRPHRLLAGDELDDALTVVADFVDLKSPFMAGHSRRCSSLAEHAGTMLGLDGDRVAALRRAGFVHDLGTTAVPNSIWDKPGPLTTAERDRMRLHPMLTEQMLRRCPGFAEFGALAAAHHEKCDGSGYHRGTRFDPLDPTVGVLVAADIYTGLTADRADRAGVDANDAAVELRRLAASGVLDAPATDAVLDAAGHRRPRRAGAKPARPAGLTAREIDVLRLAAEGLSVKAIADRLYISTKTADHHIQHIYTKIGVSSRAAAALWAMHHGIVT
jgi:HD-GYP domain-containing protein (c-di-GMP phosphodiesterase class II)